MLTDMGLNKESTTIPSQSAGNIDESRVKNPLLHEEGFVVDGDGMVIDDAVYAVIGFSEFDPVLNGSEIVADMDFACWLDSAEDPAHLFLP
jgi:hypothetical protein